MAPSKSVSIIDVQMLHNNPLKTTVTRGTRFTIGKNHNNPENKEPNPASHYGGLVPPFYPFPIRKK
jgi:hypothetical protein